MKKVVYLAVVLALLLPAALFAEGTKEEDQLGVAARRGLPTIALVMKSLANEFFQTMENGARKHQQEHADEYTLVANGIQDERSVGQQIQIIEQMIATRVNALVLAPADSAAVVPVAARAMGEDIVVINIDNKFEEAVLQENNLDIPFVGPNNRTGARKVGDYLAGQLSRGDEVAIIEGIPTAFNAQQRRQGFEDAMREAGMNIVTSQTAEWELDRANVVASSIISEYPNLKALLCANDSMALGAAAAVAAAGKTGQIHVVGFDNISAAHQMLADGRILATADQHADLLAVYGIEYALQKLKDPSIQLQDRETPVDLVTRENMAQFPPAS